ncbi:hypothetical protein Tco_1146420 [Tanacetum coccineum]
MARRRHGKRAAVQSVLILRAKSDYVPGTLARRSPHMLLGILSYYCQYYFTTAGSIMYHPRWWPEATTAAENAEKARVSEWLAHDNAIFDLCWIKVPELNMYLRIPDVIVSGSRDGFDNRFHILISKDVVDVEVICYVEELKSVQELSERMIIFLLQVAPYIRFNKEGIIMVVSTKENGITILANPNEIGLLQTMEICRSFNQSRVEGLISIDIITMMMTVSDIEAGFDGIMREEKHRCFVPRSCLGKRVTLARKLMEDEAEQFLLHASIYPNPERHLITTNVFVWCVNRHMHFVHALEAANVRQRYDDANGTINDVSLKNHR